MSTKLEDYALIGDCHGAGLVSKSGSIDWLCVPRFDSAACFAALLGTAEHGRWLIRPQAEARIQRAYRDNSLTVETTFETPEGTVRLVDCMPVDSAAVDVVRIVEGLRGRVGMRMVFSPRFDYGHVPPWVTGGEGHVQAIAGPDTLHLRSDAPMRVEGHDVVAQFEIAEGERCPFVMTHHASHLGEPEPIDADSAVHATGQFWEEWAARSQYDGSHTDAVLRSLVTLKALTYHPTGGLVAAPTTSLPEAIGGPRNWDYRFCWLRDAAVALLALLECGHREEARRWREWLLRAVAGEPRQMQVMYSVTGVRRLPELELPWLPGYEGSRPVREGNAAHEQLQLDVYGELMETMHQCRRHGLENHASWSLEQQLMEFLETQWQCRDEGIWEIRSERQHFTHSKVMCWVAFDRAIKAVERFGKQGPVERWREIRDQIHREVCERGYNKQLGAFTSHYETAELDASLLRMAHVGFLPATDPKIVSTVEAIETHLTIDGLVRRYRCETGMDGLDGSEGCFLACSFWLVDNLVLQGRRDEAQRIFDRLLELRNDVGLLAEEYDLAQERQVGNFPQAFSHLALITSAQLLSHPGGPSAQRVSDR